MDIRGRVWACVTTIFWPWFYLVKQFKGVLHLCVKHLNEAIYRVGVSILSHGRMPKHIGIVMDGNRRYARIRGTKDLVSGHTSGSEKIKEVLEWCRDLGIRSVTLYAFSIENFKRPQHEVDFLMDLACKKFEEFSGEKGMVAKHCVKVKVVGNIDLLEDRLKDIVNKLMNITATNNKHVLTIACPYTSRDEIASAIRICCKDNLEQKGNFSDNLHIKEDCDIFVRTSGEKRLSDFLVWQTTGRLDSQIYFTGTLWPAFSFKNLFFILLMYNARTICKGISTHT